LPALHVAVPAKVTPPLPSTHLLLGTVLPTAKQSIAFASYAVVGVANV
jgi:hypothetical protein